MFTNGAIAGPEIREIGQNKLIVSTCKYTRKESPRYSPSRRPQSWLWPVRELEWLFHCLQESRKDHYFLIICGLRSRSTACNLKLFLRVTGKLSEHCLLEQDKIHSLSFFMAASAALKRSIEKASAQVESLQAAVVNIWHAIGPHALASLKLSPRELESFLRRVSHLNPVRNSYQLSF